MSAEIADATLFVGSLAGACGRLPPETDWKITMSPGEVVLCVFHVGRKHETSWSWEMLAHASLGRLDLFAQEAVEFSQRQLAAPAGR